MKVYFDQNTWQYLSENISSELFKEKIRNRKLVVILGIHNIYEFARCFTDEKTSEIGKKIFSYLNSLDINDFVKRIQDLVKDDLIYARTGGRLLPYLDSDNTVATKQELFRLSIGNCETARNFILTREKKLHQSAPKYRSDVMEANIGKRKPENFTEIFNDYNSRRQILDNSEFRGDAKYLSNSLLFSTPNKYPYLNTFINAQLYFNFIALKNLSGPSKKSISDYRHLIAANAADLFVTNDERLLKNAQIVCPYIHAKSWKDFNSAELVS